MTLHFNPAHLLKEVGRLVKEAGNDGMNANQVKEALRAEDIDNYEGEIADALKKLVEENIICVRNNVFFPIHP